MAYAGQLYLSEIIKLMCEDLEWLWSFSVVHSGPVLTMRTTNFRQCWKPVLAFVKPPLTPWWVLQDLVTTGKQEKTLHPWQQAQAESDYFIEHLAPAGGLVVDPFVGGGTVAVSAAKLGRRFVGCDMEEEAVEVARGRVGNLRVKSA